MIYGVEGLLIGLGVGVKWPSGDTLVGEWKGLPAVKLKQTSPG